MQKLVDLWLAEPARIVGLVTAVLALLVAFNVPVTDAQQQAITGIVVAVLVLIGAEITRARVTPA